MSFRARSTISEGLIVCILSLGGRENSRKFCTNAVDVKDLLGDHLEILLLLGVQIEAALKRKEAHLHGGQGIADAVSHAGSELSHRRHLLRMEQVLPALLQFGLGQVEFLKKAPDAAAERLHLVVGFLPASPGSASRASLLQRLQNVVHQDKGKSTPRRRTARTAVPAISRSLSAWA